MSYRSIGIAFFMSLAACGGSSRRAETDEGRNGGTGGLGGSGTETGGAGQGATGGSDVGGSGEPEINPLSGDYWIVSDPGQIFFVTVTSPTEAKVGGEFEWGYAYDIIHTPRESLTPEGSFPSDTGLTGEFVLRNAGGAREAFEYALEGSDDNSRARIGFRSRSCDGRETFFVVAGTARRDVDPPEARVTPEWGLSPPWLFFSVDAKRPVLGPLSGDFSLTADGAPVSVTWGESAEPFVSTVMATLDDWPPLVGRTLELSGSLHGTNGTESMLGATISTPDWGMHEGPVSFASSDTPVVALWGGAMHHTPGTLGNCPDGCVGLTQEANVGMRFIRPGTSLRVTAIFNDIELELWAADGRAMIVPTPQGPFDAFETADIPIPFQVDDLFVIFRGPPPITAGSCTTPANVAYLVSVEPEGAP